MASSSISSSSPSASRSVRMNLRSGSSEAVAWWVTNSDWNSVGEFFLVRFSPLEKVAHQQCRMLDGRGDLAVLHREGEEVIARFEIAGIQSQGFFVPRHRARPLAAASQEITETRAKKGVLRVF